MGRSVAAFLSVVLIATPALGQPKTPPTDAQMTQAKDLVNKAMDKAKSGDHQAAIDLYLAAYNIAPLPLLLSNVASEYEALKKPVEAVKYFCKYLEAEPDGPQAGYATQHAKDLQIQLKNPVDDGNVCAPPKVTPPPPNPPPDGGTTTTEHHDAPPPPPPTDDPGHGMKLAGLGIGAAGVVGLALGVVYGIKAKNLSDTISNHDPKTPWENNINLEEADGKHDQKLQITFLVAGGVLAAGGAVIYVMGRGKSPAERAAIVTPVVAPSYGGFALTGRF
jgi:hypothetical protein